MMFPHIDIGSKNSVTLDENVGVLFDVVVLDELQVVLKEFRGHLGGEEDSAGLRGFDDTKDGI